MGGTIDKIISAECVTCKKHLRIIHFREEGRKSFGGTQVGDGSYICRKCEKVVKRKETRESETK
jgi:hypothetical protein